MKWCHIEQSQPEEGAMVLVSDGRSLILTEVISLFDDDGNCYIDWEDCESQDYPYFLCVELPDKNLPEFSDTDRLNWLFSNGISKFSKEILFGTIVNESNFRDEIDKLMKKGSI